MFLGVPKLGKEDLPAMPEPYDESALPNVHGSKEQRQIRLDWKKNSKDTHNHAALRTMSVFAKTQGAFYVSGVKELLDVITQGDLDARFDTKYAALQKVYRGTSGKQSTKRAAAPLKISENQLTVLGYQKLEVRERKRLALPEDSEWRNSKYDTAFTIQQMSDDEDTFDANGTLTPQTYTSRAPTSRSEIVSKLFDAVDAVRDPKGSSQYIIRVRGENKEKELPATKGLVGRTRRWMVKVDWLLQNPQYDAPKYLADSGKLWGDQLDPEETEEVIKRSAEEKKERKRKKRETEGSDNDSKSKKKGKKANGN